MRSAASIVRIITMMVIIIIIIMIIIMIGGWNADGARMERG